MQCLDDRDESIRLRALDLIKGMVSVLEMQFIILVQFSREQLVCKTLNM